MKRELGALILGLALIEGCSAPTKPDDTKVKIDYIVDCQQNPLDDNVVLYELKKGEIVRPGAKTKSGENDVIKIKANGDGTFDYSPENNDFEGLIMPGGVQAQDENILFIAEAMQNGNKTDIGVSITCNDAVPNPLAP